MTDYPIDFQLIADPVTFQRAANAPVSVYDINDAMNTSPLKLKDLNGLPMANPMQSTAEAITPPFIAPVPDIKLVGGGYSIPVSSTKGIRDVALAAADSAAASAQAAKDAASLVGTPADPAVAALLDGDTATRQKFDGRYANGAGTAVALGDKVGKGEIVVNVKDYGAKGDGVADDTAAWTRAEAAAFALGVDSRLYAPPGLYRTSGTVTIRCALDAAQATIRYYGAGTAVILGSGVAGMVTARRVFSAPRVVNMSRTTGWDGTSVGIQANNLNTCVVYVPFVQDFEKGLVMYGNAGGNAYNTVQLGALWENHKNLVLDCTPDGYSNQNTFLGGRLQHSATKGASLGDLNACQVAMVGMNSEGGPNNNTFVGTSLEGDNVAYYRVDIAGSYNQFYNCRWESPAGVSPRIRYRASALKNKIDGGYGSHNIVEIFDGTQGGGEIRDHVGAYSAATTTAGQVIPNNVWTTVTSWAAPVQRRVSYNSTSGEFTPRPGRWRIIATVTFAPNATGRRMARLNIAGAVPEIAEAPGNTNRTTLKLQAVALFDSVKTVKVECFQTSGADLALETTAPYVQFQAEYMGY